MGGPLEKSISYTAAITEARQENEFSLRFAVASFTPVRSPIGTAIGCSASITTGVEVLG